LLLGCCGEGFAYLLVAPGSLAVCCALLFSLRSRSCLMLRLHQLLLLLLLALPLSIRQLLPLSIRQLLPCPIVPEGFRPFLAGVRGQFVADPHAGQGVLPCKRKR
jgi:hypothetical protein